MKKILYSFLLFTVALVSTTALVSCGDDDENDAPQPSQTASLDFKLWVTEDLLKIADIKATGVSTPLSCTNKFGFDVVHPLSDKTLHYEGLTSQTIHLEGEQAKNAKINVTFELKPNWKELIAGQEEVKCRSIGLYAYKVGTATHTNIGLEVPDGTEWGVKDILASEASEKIFVDRIARLSASFNAAAY